MPTGAQNLGSQLGQLIFGKPDDGKAYYQGQALGAQVADRMASARKNRADAMIGEDRLDARQGINPGALTTAGYAPDQAALLGSILRSNDVVDLSRLGDLQAPTAGKALADAADATRLGDIAMANRQLALAQGKPLEATKVDQGQVFNPYAAPDQPIQMTALGDAMVGDKRASAAQHYAGAQSDLAHARLFDKQTSVGGFNPRAGGTGFGGDNGNSFTPEAQDLLAAAAEQGFQIPIPSVGMGGSARVQYVNGLAKHLKDSGLPLDVSLQTMRFGLTSDPAIKQSQKLYSSTKTLEAGADALAQQALDLSSTVGRGQIPLFNEWVNAGRRATSDPNIARFDRAINAFTHDYAKVVSGALGSSAGTDSSIAEAKRQLMASNSPEVFAANVDQMQKEMHVRTDGMLDSIRQQVANLSNRGRAPGLGAQPDGQSSLQGAMGSAPAQPAHAGGYQIGQIIMHNGKPYRVTGGDPNDPDVEPVQ